MQSRCVKPGQELMKMSHAIQRPLWQKRHSVQADPALSMKLKGNFLDSTFSGSNVSDSNIFAFDCNDGSEFLDYVLIFASLFPPGLYIMPRKFLGH